MLILYQLKKNPLHRSHNSHHKQNRNSHVNKFSSLPFVAVITNREAYWCSARNSSGAARPCGAAAPRNGDAHGARLRSEGSLLLSDVPSVHAKMAKYALLTAARAEVPDHAAHAEGSNSAPIRNAPVSPCDPLCAILLAKVSVYPLSPVKTNVSRLCECDLKPLRRGLSHAVWDVTSADWAVIGGFYL